MELQRRPIAMSASLGDAYLESEVQTKTDDPVNPDVNADPYTGTPVNNPLEVALWFSYQPGSYSHNPAFPQWIPCMTTMNYNSSTAEDVSCMVDEESKILQYPIATDPNYSEVGDNVYCVGFYPADEGWEYSSVETENGSENSAKHAIDGSKDLMFAEQMVGSYSSNFSTQTYNHLLTWVKINLSASSFNAAQVWGCVDWMKIESPAQTVKITFSEDLDNGKPKASSVAFEGEAKELSFKLPEDKSLSLTTRTFAQAFCAPPAVGGQNNSCGYKIKVKTENLEEKEVFVELKTEKGEPVSGDYAKGKLFVINLRFNDIRVIEGVCTLKQWEDQSNDIYLSEQKEDNNESL